MRAILFDYGEVLCTPDPVAYRKLLALTGLDAPAFERAYWPDRRDYDLGLSGQEYWTRFAARAGLAFDSAHIAALIENDVALWTHLSEPMLAWAAALRDSGIATAILSNMVPEVLRYMRQEFAWLADFSQLTFSCELGIVKPDPEIYLYTCRQLGVAPAQALFLDDKLENVRGAEQAGLPALRFISIPQLRADLAARGWRRTLPQPGAGSVALPA